MSRSRLAFLAALLAALSLGTAVAADPPQPAASRAHPAKPAFPQLNLPEAKAQGQRAIDLLGARLPEVAAWYGKSADEFKALLLNDRRLRIDRRGRLFVEDELETPLPADPASASTSSLQSGDLLPLEQTFLLHSRPGAKRTIYLNFGGAVLTNTAWNSTGSTITALPFDTDGVPYSFSTAELQRIQYIWQRVAEDYAPFDVNVTTEPPAADLLTRSGSTDQVFGTTVLVTSRSGVYSCSCGGVAYVGIFDDTSNYYKPALVFYDALGGGNEKYVAEAISHEAGHNMGLLHDGNASTGYYTGHGSGATGWAPIMGVGYYQPLVQWSQGEYSGANNIQDDFKVMETNGLPIRLDDHGDVTGAATPLASEVINGVISLVADGVIERPSDIDAFSFATGAGAVTVTVHPAGRSPNLDLLVELRNGAGTLLASGNPVDALPASLTASLASSGTYYVTVQGVGKGDRLTTGYTDYGSLGVYAVTVVAPTAASQPPVAAFTAAPTRGTVPLIVAFSGSGSTDPDGTITAYEWTFGDNSAPVAVASPSHIYNAAGSYIAQLKVTDNSGLSATKSVTITVDPVVAVIPMRVDDIAMSLSGNTRSARAIAKVTVLDGERRPVSGATVTGTWSGVVNGTGSAQTTSTGVASLSSPNTKLRGTFTFTVTGVSLPGYAYDSRLNGETSDSITR